MFKNREIGEFHRSQKEKNLIERNKFYAEKLNELQEVKLLQLMQCNEF